MRRDVLARGLAHLAAAAVLLSLGAAGALAQSIAPSFCVTNGQVSAQVLRGNTLYVGGSFSFVGPVTGAGVPVDPASGLAAAGFPRVNGTVLAAVPDGAGGWYIGGQFTTVGSSPRANLARVLADNSVSPWNPGAGGIVRTMVLRAGALYVGGDFLTLAGTARNRIGAVDATTGALSAWNPNASSSVRAFAAGATQLYVGGQFTSIGGQVRNRIAALDYTTGAAAVAWDPNASSLVLALALDPATNTLYVGGQFTQIDLSFRRRIAALDATTGFATAWNPDCDNQVFALTVSAGTVYVGGQFANIGGQPRNRIAAVDAVTGAATAWNPNAGNIVQAMALSGTTLYVGGDFLSIGGQNRSRVAALSTTSGLATAWNPSAFGTVSVLATAGTQVFVGGSFNGLGGVARNNLAAIDVTTGLVTAWDPNANNQVQTLVATPDAVFAGGNFTLAGGQIRNGAAALDWTNGSALLAWDANVNGPVSAMAVAGGRVFLGGLFTTVGGQPRANLAAVDATTGAPLPWSADTDAQVFAIDASTSTVYVGGAFTLVAGQVRSFIASLDPVTAAVSAWAPEASATVNVIRPTCDRVYVGGQFTVIGGQLRGRLATLDLVTAQALAWDPEMNGPVFTLLPGNGVVYVGGVFSAAGITTRNRVAALDPDTGLPTAWDPNSNGTVRSILAGATSLYVGGVFSTLTGAPTGNLAVLTPDTSVPCPAITLAAPPLAGGVTGSPYTAAVAATGGSGTYCYAVSSGALPAGLTLNPTSGALTGTPTGTGNSAFTVTATDSRGCSGSAFYVLSVTAAPPANTVTPGTGLPCLSPVNACVPVPFTFTRGDATGLRALSVIVQLDPAKLRLCTPATPGVNVHLGTWAAGFANRTVQVADLGGGRIEVDLVLLGSPCGETGGGTLFTLDMAALGPAGTGSIAVAQVVARDSTNQPVAAKAGPASSIGILATAIALAPASLPGGIVGAAYSQSITASGGVAPFAFAVSAGALPAGLTLSSAGVLSGTCTLPGTYGFTVRATETTGCSAIRSLSVVVTCPPIPVAPAFLPDGAVGTAYTGTVTASGGLPPYTFTLQSGTLPPGVTLAANGQMTGTPTAATTATFTVLATDAGGCTGTKSYTVDIFSAPPNSFVQANTANLAISTAHPCVSVPITFVRGETATASGVTVSFQLDPTLLALCGTPAASIHLGSWFNGFTNTSLAVTDNGGGAYTVDANLLGAPCGPTTGGALFTVDVRSIGADGQGAITVTRVKARTCAPAPLAVAAGPVATLRIQNTPIPLAPATLPNAVAGTPYGQAITAQTGFAPYTFTVAAGALPGGLTLSPAGVLSGTPSATGNFSFTAAVADRDGVPGTRAYTMNVACPVISLAQVSLPDAQKNVAYAQTFTASGGTPPYRFSISAGTLPSGLTLAPNGDLAGVPTVNGTYLFTVTATDAFNCSGSAPFTLSVFTDPAVSRILPMTAGLCLGGPTTCVTVPFVYQRGDSTAARSAHVVFQVDPRFTLCGTPAASIRAGTWLSTFTNRTFAVVANGGGSYTVDVGLTGTPCGQTKGGTLFTVDLTSAGPDGVGDLTVTACRTLDCASLPLPAQPGSPAQLVIDHVAPPRVVDLVASQVAPVFVAGDPQDSLVSLKLTWTRPPLGNVSIYRGSFGGYPGYDNSGGSLPDSILAPGAPWTLINPAATPPLVDKPPVRGCWYYVAFVTDSCGNRAVVSNRTRGTVNYLLGDVSDVAHRGVGNNRVGIEDMSVLGAHYGISAARIATDGVGFLDVGPTADGTASARPLTDGLINFEDLILFSLNFAVTPFGASVEPAPAALAGKPESFELSAPPVAEPGSDVVATLRLDGAGGIQGFSVQLAWNASVVEPVAVTPAGFVESQGGVVLSPQAGAVDAALLGVRGHGFAGAGDVATFEFRVLREGDPGIRIASITARDAANQPVAQGRIDKALVAATPAHTVLLAPAPNPAHGSALLSFALAQRGNAELALYAVDGRRITTLARGAREAGLYHVAWNGDDDAGHRAAPGVYWVRLTALGRTYERRIVFLNGR